MKADVWVTALIMRKPVMAVPHFLIASYMYYVEGEAILSDATFDEAVVKTLMVHKNLVHPHRHLITDEHLEAGTGFDLKYPSIVPAAAAAMRKRFA